MNDQIFGRVPFLLIDTITNTYTRYLGKRRTGQWRSEEPISRSEVEALRVDPISFFGDGDPRGVA